MKPLSVSTVSELAQAIQLLLRRDGRRWIYRGHADHTWSLLPSVRRDYTRAYERYLSNEFYARARTRHASCPEARDFAGWLSLMQHYGLPTRLLDWSYSPLIAAYFAVFEHGSSGRDACVWALAPRAFNRAQGFEDLIYPLDARVLLPLVKPALKGDDSSDRIAAAMAVETDPRMQMQQGAFTVHASDTPIERLTGCDAWLRKMIIPRAVIAKFANEMELLGYRIDYLFPDLGSLARELKRFFPSATNKLLRRERSDNRPNHPSPVAIKR
jgi:FRG domain